jgi:AcrR family transcriptional regulator
MPTTTLDPRSPRDRLLDAADELFYGEGVHTVGIDRIIDRAGVAKATLYSAFGSKDELIRAYLARRHQARQDRILQRLSTYDTPRDQLLAVFDDLGTSFAQPDFHGCAFANASAEARPDSAIVEVTDESRVWIRTLFTDLTRAAGADQPDVLARTLHLLYDGATASARMDRDPGSAGTARAAAAELIDAAVGRAGPVGGREAPPVS